MCKLTKLEIDLLNVLINVPCMWSYSELSELLKIPLKTLQKLVKRNEIEEITYLGKVYFRTKNKIQEHFIENTAKKCSESLQFIRYNL